MNDKIEVRKIAGLGREFLFFFLSPDTGDNKDEAIFEYIPGYGSIPGDRYLSYSNSMEFDEKRLSLDKAREYIIRKEKEAGEMVDKARALAKKVHARQTDLGGNDYFLAHVEKVAESTVLYKKTGPVGSPLLKTVAYLHDILESTDLTAFDLKEMGFSEYVVQNVVTLTRYEDEDYMDYIADVKRSPVAAAVKTAELIGNMDLSRIPHPDKKDLKRTDLYRKALVFLLG